MKRCLFRRRAFRRPLEWFDLERLSVRDALGGKPGGNDAFEQGVAGEAVTRAVRYRRFRLRRRAAAGRFCRWGRFGCRRRCSVARGGRGWLGA